MVALTSLNFSELVPIRPSFVVAGTMSSSPATCTFVPLAMMMSPLVALLVLSSVRSSPEAVPPMRL